MDLYYKNNEMDSFIFGAETVNCLTLFWADYIKPCVLELDLGKLKLGLNHDPKKLGLSLKGLE